MTQILTSEDIRLFRTQNGMSQREMADFCGITQGQLSKLEAGTRTADGALKIFLLIKTGKITVSEALSLATGDEPLDKLLAIIRDELST